LVILSRNLEKDEKRLCDDHIRRSFAQEQQIRAALEHISALGFAVVFSTLGIAVSIMTRFRR
jgi:hypothetical protein